MADQTQDVGEMEAGRELDVRVGIEVMGWEPWYVVDEDAPFFTPRVPDGPPDLLDYWTTDTERMPCGWSPSTDISDAWEVVVAMEERGRVVHLMRHSDAAGGVWRASFGDPDGSHAPTAPLAICLAALTALADPSTRES